MLTIALASSKGGVGKSTLATNITVDLHDSGIGVTLVDAEEGGPTASLLEEHVPDISTYVVTSITDISRSVEELRRKGQVVILDSPGKTGKELTAVCSLADLVILPMKVCERDLLQSGAALAVVRSCQLTNQGKPQAVIVYNETSKDDAEASNFTKQLAPLGIPVAKSRIRSLRSVRRATTIMRPPWEKMGVAEDTKNLIDEIIAPLLVPVNVKVGNG